MRTLIHAVAGYNLAETARHIEIAKACKKLYDIIFLSYGGQFEKLIDLNLTIIEHLMARLKVAAEVRLLSELSIEAKEPHLSVEICKKLGASYFLAQSDARKYLDRALFRMGGVELVFFNPRPPVYPQLWGAFIPNLSVFDLLFNCGPKGSAILMKV